MKRTDDNTYMQVSALAKALFLKDRLTGEHCHRVACYSMKLGLAYGFSDEEAATLKQAGLLHDIGKIAIPDSILKKPFYLTDDEYAVMKRHPVIGADILGRFGMPREVVCGALYHHERYDGRGYPDGLSEGDIPLYGRIITIADTFDAMTANRVYRGALDINKVKNELERGMASQFDPELAGIFLEELESGRVDPKKTFEMFRYGDLTGDIQ